jgi:IS30 family transposase
VNVNLTPEEINDLKQRETYSREQIAERFNVALSTVHNWLREGRFRTQSGQPAAWQENTGYREWHVLAEAVHRLEAAMQVTKGQGDVHIHDCGDVSVLVVEYAHEDETS